MLVAARVFSVSHVTPRENGIKAAKEALSAGRAIVLPTDTSYALAVRARDEKALNLLWQIKGQNPKTPLTIFIGNISLLKNFCAGITDEAKNNFLSFWPGPVTLILKGLSNLTWNKGVAPNKVSVRMPLHPVAFEILGNDEILATTTANKVGQGAGKSITEIKAQFGSDVSVYLDQGELPVSVPSSILDLSGEFPILVREGSVTFAQISEVFKDIVK